MADETEAGPPPQGTEPAAEQTGRPGPLKRGGGSGGALTGETGMLSGEGEDHGQEAFVPAETREMSDPLAQGQITAASADASAEHRRQVQETATRTGGGGRGEGADAAIPGAGPLATERASGLTGLQGQAHAMGGTTSAEVGGAAGAGATELAGREGGYGGSHGLAPDDPAYLFTESVEAAEDETAPGPPPDRDMAEPERRKEPEHF